MACFGCPSPSPQRQTLPRTCRLCRRSLPEDPTPAQFAKWEHKKATLTQAIEERRLTIENLKTQRKAAGKHIEIRDLPPCDRFSQLRTEKKHFIDTIKLIAYRAETAMAGLVRQHLRRHDDARSLLRQLYQSKVDLKPDPPNKTLMVRLHHLSAHVHDAAIAKLCEELTETETVFPGTDLRLIFEFVGSS